MAPTEESAPEVPVTEEVMPDLEVPEDSGAQPTSRSGAVDVRALAKDVAVSVREILLGDEEFIKRSQAVKDKRLKLLDEDNPALVQRVVKYLKKYDGDEEEVARQIRLDALAEGARASAKEPSGEADPGRSEPRGPEPKEDLKSWVSRPLTEAGIREIYVHTGQHFDQAMSQVFFDELQLKAPEFDASSTEKLKSWVTMPPLP